MDALALLYLRSKHVHCAKTSRFFGLFGAYFDGSHIKKKGRKYNKVSIKSNHLFYIRVSQPKKKKLFYIRELESIYELNIKLE